MATYTPTSKVIGATGASGQTGFAALITAQNAAVATAVTTAMALTGFVPNSLLITGPAVSQDVNGGTLYMSQAVNYVVQS